MSQQKTETFIQEPYATHLQDCRLLFLGYLSSLSLVFAHSALMMCLALERHPTSGFLFVKIASNDSKQNYTPHNLFFRCAQQNRHFAVQNSNFQKRTAGVCAGRSPKHTPNGKKSRIMDVRFHYAEDQ